MSRIDAVTRAVNVHPCSLGLVMPMLLADSTCHVAYSVTWQQAAGVSAPSCVLFDLVRVRVSLESGVESGFVSYTHGMHAAMPSAVSGGGTEDVHSASTRRIRWCSPNCLSPAVCAWYLVRWSFAVGRWSDADNIADSGPRSPPAPQSMLGSWHHTDGTMSQAAVGIDMQLQPV